jgi:hypothetical protein
MASTSMSAGSGVRLMQEPWDVNAVKGTTGSVWNAHRLSKKNCACGFRGEAVSRNSSIHCGVRVGRGRRSDTQSIITVWRVGIQKKCTVNVNKRTRKVVICRSFDRF